MKINKNELLKDIEFLNSNYQYFYYILNDNENNIFDILELNYNTVEKMEKILNKYELILIKSNKDKFINCIYNHICTLVNIYTNIWVDPNDK